MTIVYSLLIASSREVLKDEAAVAKLSSKMDADWQELRNKLSQQSRELRLKDDTIRKMSAKSEATFL
jgi:hypothetical protein